MDFSVLQKLGKEPKYYEQKERIRRPIRAGYRGFHSVESNEILTKTVVIHFSSNSWDLSKKITETADGKDVEKLYDPSAPFVVEEIGENGEASSAPRAS